VQRYVGKDRIDFGRITDVESVYQGSGYESCLFGGISLSMNPPIRLQLIAAIRDVRWANILIGRDQVLDTHRNQGTEGDLRTMALT